MTLSRVGEAELAWTAGDRSVAAAEAAERPLLGAVSAYRLGYVLIRLKRAGQAEDLLLRAADALSSSPRRSKAPALSVRGGLYLAAATAAAARFDRASADRHLTAARKIAGGVGGDRNDFWSAFGPTNVAIHEVSIAVTFGDAKLALQHGEPLDSGPAGKALNPGLSQTVECSTAEADGRLWWWWLWSGPTRDAPPELEPLCPADEIDLAADRIARVLAERGNDSES